jgi:predicted secreted hydrolase
MKNKLGAVLALLLAATICAADYKVALPGYPYQFPRDHFDHPDYQTEWWYYTGNLKSHGGRRFGFELTFFRQGIARDRNPSPWHIQDLYMAHLALSDLRGRHFYHAQRINRAGPGIAGVNQQSGLIWNGNWQAQLQDDRQQLRGISEDFDLNLDLKTDKFPVIHGRNGVSQKSEGAGHASHYISFTRLLTSGSIELNGTTYQVEGTSWMDHEFFTESMDSTETGWDWLGLQFNDNTELMLYRLRHKDGSVDPYSSGTYIDARGQSFFLSAKDFTMTPSADNWTSPQTEATYPVRWRVSIPSRALDFDIAAALPSQELTSAIGPSYWEGAVDVAGQAGSPNGVGYLEMTGYAKTHSPNAAP